ncbi:hypothetical protein HDV00_012399 [Rhizophlyctis rosea]|nr:hypothetical protein HDV00_012399 [Rhizophlyctis rosea]
MLLTLSPNLPAFLPWSNRNLKPPKPSLTLLEAIIRIAHLNHQPAPPRTERPHIPTRRSSLNNLPPDTLHETLLHAVMHRNIRMVETLLADERVNVNMPIESSSAPSAESVTPLVEASVRGFEELVEILVGAGADVRWDGDRAVVAAVLANYFAITAFLLIHINTTQPHPPPSPALLHAIRTRNPNLATLLPLFLPAEQYLPSDLRHVVDAAEEAGDWETLKFLKCKGAEGGTMIRVEVPVCDSESESGGEEGEEVGGDEVGSGSEGFVPVRVEREVVEDGNGEVERDDAAMDNAPLVISDSEEGSSQGWDDGDVGETDTDDDAGVKSDEGSVGVFSESEKIGGGDDEEDDDDDGFCML